MYITTTRFNNKTYVENMKWKIKNNFNGCCYFLNHKISQQIHPNKNIIVDPINRDNVAFKYVLLKPKFAK